MPFRHITGEIHYQLIEDNVDYIKAITDNISNDILLEDYVVRIIIAGCTNVIKLFLDRWISSNTIDESCIPLIHHAVTSYYGNNIELLMEYGADINQKDNNGNTTLHQILNDISRNIKTLATITFGTGMHAKQQSNYCLWVQIHYCQIIKEEHQKI